MKYFLSLILLSLLVAIDQVQAQTTMPLGSCRDDADCKLTAPKDVKEGQYCCAATVKVAGSIEYDICSRKPSYEFNNNMIYVKCKSDMDSARDLIKPVLAVYGAVILAYALNTV